MYFLKFSKKLNIIYVLLNGGTYFSNFLITVLPKTNYNYIIIIIIIYLIILFNIIFLIYFYYI